MLTSPILTKNSVEGILLLNKPKTKTSFYLVHLLRKLTHVKKIGHAGTLDPIATGVMVMLIGKNYTRLSDQLMKSDKEYEVDIQLGIETDSYDLDGEVISRSSLIPTLKEIESCLTTFQGSIEQIPPMYSAKKVAGKKLYLLAREGQEVERKPVLVNVQTTLLEYNYPTLRLRIACSKGTYIRSIAHDLGLMLGCYGAVSDLVRTKSGLFTLDQCLTVDEIRTEDFDFAPYLIRSLPDAPHHLPHQEPTE
ncbi:MAG: tRNA pseudouridine synthase B [Chlamydiia bacterium]|nr:tRNA pseudouridine synthase B [Chlamydiia bacterium]